MRRLEDVFQITVDISEVYDPSGLEWKKIAEKLQEENYRLRLKLRNSHVVTTDLHKGGTR